MRYIIVGNSPHHTFNKIYIPQEDDYLIGLDVGCHKIIDLGFKLNEAWGDFDYLDNLDSIKKHTNNIFKYPVEKNETDLELLLQHLLSLNIKDEIYIYDVTGGRLDHELVNINLLKKYHQLDIKIIDDKNIISYIDEIGKHSFEYHGFDYIGLLPFHEAVISIDHGKYTIPKTLITTTDTYTTSNQFIDNVFSFTLFDGAVLLIISKE